MNTLLPLSRNVFGDINFAFRLALFGAALVAPLFQSFAGVRVGAINMTAAAGAVLEIPIGLAGTDNVTCLQMELLFDPAKVALGAARTGVAAPGHRIDSSIVSSGRERVVLYSTTLAPLDGGYIVQVPVTWTVAGNSGVTLVNVKLVAPNGTVVALTSTDLSPIIITNPVAGDVAPGANVTLRVEADGLKPLTYEWKLNGLPVAGGTASELALTNVTASNAGNYTAMVSNAAGSATSAPATLTVSTTAAPIALSNLRHIYDGTSKSATVTTNPAGLPFTITYEGASQPPVNAGLYAVVATITDPSRVGTASGTLEIAQATATVALGSLNQTYNGMARTVTAATTPVGLAISLTYDGSASAPINAGSYPVRGTVTNPNYQGSSPGTLNVAKATITVKADDKQRPYGSINPPFTHKFEGLLGPDTSAAINGVPGLPSTAVLSSSVGEYPITPTVGSLNAVNYTFAFADGTLTVTKAPLTVIADNKTKVQGEVNPPLTASYVGFANAETSSVLAGEPVLTTTAVKESLTGTYPISITPGSLVAQNYAFQLRAGTLTVTGGDFAARIDSPSSGSIFPVEQKVVFTGSFTSSVSGNHTANWIFSSPTLETPIELPGTILGNEISLETSFATPGVYSVTLTVKNPEGTSVSASTVGDNANADAVVVIYNADGGFVSGGGWVWSPQGAFSLNGQIEGRAEFEFVSKYQKRKTAPEGDTVFKFSVGGVNFTSSGYHWLIVSGSFAQFRGSGIINGVADFDFILTAIDGDAKKTKGDDHLRIQIWDTKTGETIYDNQRGPDEAALGPATVLRGGNIEVHSK